MMQKLFGMHGQGSITPSPTSLVTPNYFFLTINHLLISPSPSHSDTAGKGCNTYKFKFCNACSHLSTTTILPPNCCRFQTALLLFTERGIGHRQKNEALLLCLGPFPNISALSPFITKIINHFLLAIYHQPYLISVKDH